jgi:hypothetical protein
VNITCSCPLVSARILASSLVALENPLLFQSLPGILTTEIRDLLVLENLHLWSTLYLRRLLGRCSSLRLEVLNNPHQRLTTSSRTLIFYSSNSRTAQPTNACQTAEASPAAWTSKLQNLPKPPKLSWPPNLPRFAGTPQTPEAP